MTSPRYVKKNVKRQSDDREYTYDEFVKEFAPDLLEQEEESDEQFATRLAKDTIDILRDGKIRR